MVVVSPSDGSWVGGGAGGEGGLFAGRSVVSTTHGFAFAITGEDGVDAGMRGGPGLMRRVAGEVERERALREGRRESSEAPRLELLREESRPREKPGRPKLRSRPDIMAATAFLLWGRLGGLSCCWLLRRA